MVHTAQSNIYIWIKKRFFSTAQGYKWQSQIKLQKEKASIQKALNRISLNSKCLRLRRKKGKFWFNKLQHVLHQLVLFVTPKPRAFFCARNAFAGWYIITAPCECFLDTNTTSCSKAAISWKQSIHCFLNDHDELYKSNQMWRRCVYIFALNQHVLCHLKTWLAILVSQGQGNLHVIVQQSKWDWEKQ